MGPPGGGRNTVTHRFLRHFNVIGMESFDEDTMRGIFAPIMDWHFKFFETSLRRFSRQAITSFLPTPSRSHYVFNLRDFSRVVQGVLLLKPQAVPDGMEGSHKIIRSWVHEVYRVFYDRLVDDKDRDTFFKLTKMCVESQFKEKMNVLFGHLVEPGKHVTDDNIRSLLFGDYMSKAKEERLYDEIQDLEELREVNKTKAEMQFWEEKRKSMPTTARFVKCKKQLERSNHINLMGISGEGKTSLAMELLRQSGREPIIVREPEQWEVIDVENGRNKIVLIDDIFGRFSLNSATKEAWLKKVTNMYATVRGGKVQIITTCREHIFMTCDTELKKYDLFKESNVHLSRAGSNYCLEPADKLEILKIQLSNSKIDQFSEEDLEQIANIKYTSVGFPQCCHVFMSDPKYIDRGVEFFERPFEVIEEVLDQMSKSQSEETKFDYCVLGCVLIFEGLSRECIEKIDDDKTDEFSLVTEIAKACQIKAKNLFSTKITNAADRLSTSYLTCEDGKYSFQHNSMLEAVFKSFFESKAKLLLQRCDWRLLRDLISSEGSEDKSVVCIVPKRHYGDLSRRLVSELTRYRPALTAEPFTPTGSSMTPGRKELLGPAKSKVKVETETSTSGINTTTNNNIDLEMELMEADEEIARLTAELQTAGKQRELESKRREIAKLRGELQHQSGSQSTGASSTTTSSSRLPSSIASGKRSHEGEVDITGNIDMDNLRKMDRLVQKVDKHMNDLKVRFCQDSDDDSGSGESDSISNEQKEIKMITIPPNNFQATRPDYQCSLPEFTSPPDFNKSETGYRHVCEAVFFQKFSSGLDSVVENLCTSALPQLNQNIKIKMYEHFRLLDIPSLREKMPVTLDMFMQHAEISVKVAADKLHTQWLQECCDLVDSLRDEVEDWMPNGDDEQDLENACIKFKPEFNNIISKFYEVIDLMVLSVQDIPCIESLLFQTVEDVSDKIISFVKIDEEVVVLAKSRINTVIIENTHGPERQVI
ncbi:hypothetical protein ScPMuIL_007495 [Solemya velum]